MTIGYHAVLGPASGARPAQIGLVIGGCLTTGRVRRNMLGETSRRIRMHHFIRAVDAQPRPAFPRNAAGYRRFALSDRSVGAVHSGWGLTELDAGGHLNLHIQSFEKSFYVLAGNPALILDGRGYRLSPGACGLIPVGMQHAWLGPTSGTRDGST